MADINIQVGDQVIAVPEWASETTLRQLRSSYQNNARFERALLKLMGSAGDSLEGVERATKNMAQNVSRETKKREKDNVQTGRKVGRAFNGLINRFNQTEKPLSAMVDLVGDFGSGVNGVIGGLGKINNKFGGFMGTVSKNLSKYGGPIMEAGLAYAGFVAAKVEQFADAQKTLIDAGAIFMQGGIQGFEELRSRTYDAGISYEALSKTVSSYGVAIQSLSNGVSGGTDRFVDYFTALNDTADNFGDFGMASADMATAYAEYINVQRLTGQINKDTTDVQSKLNKGFTDLMLETSALAALTGENRSELLKRRMSALSEVDVAASLKILRGQGREGSAQVLEEITKQLADVAPHFGEIGQTITDALNREAFASANNIGTFDIRRTMDPTMVGAIEKSMPDLLDNINSKMQSGNVEGASNMVRDALMNVQQVQFGSALAGKDTVAGLVREIQKSSILVNQAQGNVKGMGKDEMDAQKKIAGEQLKASGEITKNFNSLTEGFLKAQDALTPSLDMASETLRVFGDTLKSGADFLQGVNQERKDRVEKLFGNKDEKPEARKMGGPVMQGEPYTVGERGPELFVPNSSGEILNASQIQELFNPIFESQKYDGQSIINRQLKDMLRDPSAKIKFQPSPNMIDDMAAAGQWDKIYETIPDNMKQYFDMPGDNLTGKDGFDISWSPTDGWSGSKMLDNGEQIKFDEKGRYLMSGAGTVAHDHSGKFLYSKSPKFAGLQTTKYADGTSERDYTLSVNMGDGDVNIGKIAKYNALGEMIDDRTEISAGAMYVGMNENGNMDLSYNMGGGLSISGSANQQTGMSKMTASYQMFGPDGQRGVLTNEDSLNFGAISDVDQKFLQEQAMNRLYKGEQEIQEMRRTRTDPYDYYKKQAKEMGLTNEEEYATNRLDFLKQLKDMIKNTKQNYIVKRSQENLDA